MKLCSENSNYHLAYKIQLSEKFLPYFTKINVTPPHPDVTHNEYTRSHNIWITWKWKNGL